MRLEDAGREICEYLAQYIYWVNETQDGSWRGAEILAKILVWEAERTAEHLTSARNARKYSPGALRKLSAFANGLEGLFMPDLAAELRDRVEKLSEGKHLSESEVFALGVQKIVGILMICNIPYPYYWAAALLKNAAAPTGILRVEDHEIYSLTKFNKPPTATPEMIHVNERVARRIRRYEASYANKLRKAQPRLKEQADRLDEVLQKPLAKRIKTRMRRDPE